MRSLWHITAAVAFNLTVASGAATQAADIKVLASNAVAEVMKDLVPEFERTTGQRVVVDYGPTNGIMARIKGGEAADVVILIKKSVTELQAAGKVVADSQIDVARTSMGLAVRAGAPKPDISTPDAFKRAMLNAKSVAFSKIGASGIHLMGVFERLGIAEDMKPKIRLVQGATRAADLVLKGEAEIAVQMLSELQPVVGVEVVGPLPGDLQFQIVLTAAVSPDAKDRAAAMSLVRFLTGPSAASVLKKKGMEGV